MRAGWVGSSLLLLDLGGEVDRESLAFAIVAVLVVVSLLTIGVEDTNIAISIATLLMVFVLQNTQDRDSAALHLKLDEMIHAEPDAREIVRGIEVKSEAEIKGMTLEETDSVTPGA